MMIYYHLVDNSFMKYDFYTCIQITLRQLGGDVSIGSKIKDRRVTLFVISTNEKTYSSSW